MMSFPPRATGDPVSPSTASPPPDSPKMAAIAGLSTSSRMAAILLQPLLQPSRPTTSTVGTLLAMPRWPPPQPRVASRLAASTHRPLCPMARCTVPSFWANHSGAVGSSENLHSALCCCYASLHVHVLRSVCIVLRRPCRVSGRRVSVCACVSRGAPEPSPLSSPGGRAGGYRGVRCPRAEISPLLLHPISLLPVGSIPTRLGIVATLCATGASASSRAELTALLGV